MATAKSSGPTGSAPRDFGPPGGSSSGEPPGSSTPEERFTTEVLRQARNRPHLCAEEIAWLIFGLENVLDDVHVDLVKSVFLDAGLDPNGILDDSDTVLIVELMEQVDVVNHGRTRSGDWQPLEPVEIDDSIRTDFGKPAVFSPYGELSPKRYVERPRKHGTAYVAGKLGCKCDLCTAWKREHQRKMRAARKSGADVTTPSR